MGESGRVRRNSSLPFQELEGRVVVVVPARRQMHQLDEVASFLWNQLREPRSARELARSLSEEFEVEPDRAERDVEAFLSELEKKGLTGP